MYNYKKNNEIDYNNHYNNKLVFSTIFSLKSSLEALSIVLFSWSDIDALKSSKDISYLYKVYYNSRYFSSHY